VRLIERLGRIKISILTIMGINEIECRFLEIDKDALIKKLRNLGATDKGEKTLDETIVYDPEFKWRDEQKFVRLRRAGDKTYLTYKDHSVHSVDGTIEVEFGVDNYEKAEMFLKKIGLVIFRRQQKIRHTFQLEKVTVDIDQWPKIPVYVELEGNSEKDLKAAASILGLRWENADFHGARWVIENKYNIPVSKMRWFTFDKVE